MHRLQGIPVVLFEPNASVGLTNRTLQPIADALLLGWPSSRNARQVIGNGRRSAEFVGMPLRGQLLRMIGKGQRERAQLHAAAKQRLGIPWRRSTTSLSGIAASSCSSQPAFGSSSSTSQGRFSKDLSVEQRGGGGGGRVHGWLSRVRGRRSRLVVVLGGALGCRNLNFIMHQALPQLLSVRGGCMLLSMSCNGRCYPAVGQRHAECHILYVWCIEYKH